MAKKLSAGSQRMREKNMKNKLSEEQKLEIYRWIFDNHGHHDSEECEDASFPYVNSKDLVKFLEVEEKL